MWKILPLAAAFLPISLWGIPSLATSLAEPPLLLAEIQGWDMTVSMEPLLNRNSEPVALTVQLKIRKKPVTSYANVVYQLFAQKENNWVPVYTSTGARLIANTTGDISLDPEIIPIAQLRQALGGNVDLSGVDIKALVQVRYDGGNNVKDQQIQLETLESFGSIAGRGNSQQTQNLNSNSNVRETALQAANQTATPMPEVLNLPGKNQFSLAILRTGATGSDVIVRLSLKAKRGEGYLRERFMGDFRYKPNARANFMKGLSAGDRIVVRLYDLENRPIGYSEFELPAETIAVNLVLPENTAISGVVRTLYGIDANGDGKLDDNRRLGDYFTELTVPQNGGERVTFLSRLPNINISGYQVGELPPPSANSVYPPAFSSGAFSVMNRTVALYGTGIAPALRAEPGKIYQIVNVPENSASTYYDVSEFMANYREKGVSEGIQVSFPDVPATHWAKNYISELAAREILQGFMDGNFRPNEPVTRAEFAAMIRRAFNLPKVRKAMVFQDVPANHWASAAIREAYEMGFFEGETFNPEKKLDRLDAVVVLANGLKFSPKNSADTVLKVYSDSASIPAESRNAVAAATERRMVVNADNANIFNPSQMATRADVAAFLYQAMME
ncbi:S-layer homology domain-containing protein [Ancylothrix sp. D3o]|uniref:S-layer homology domain-containing protein n=1 Tax=Ancylothrix sp. D3o TaxID=2953691 RepID=UPI0021BA7FE9|nr:S-layer homology domain-containing protein [Ancylothrix sp. D3o]